SAREISAPCGHFHFQGRIESRLGGEVRDRAFQPVGGASQRLGVLAGDRFADRRQHSQTTFNEQTPPFGQQPSVPVQPGQGRFEVQGLHFRLRLSPSRLRGQVFEDLEEFLSVNR